MEPREIVEALYRKGEVSRETWKALSVKNNGDGTVDILYKNLQVGTKKNPVFLWVYANVVGGDDVRVLERITFKTEDIVWIARYLPGKWRREGL
ncbi:hypothetical protein [Thermococcus sp.]|nr:hypothetical protein [Thermococcus sp.]